MGCDIHCFAESKTESGYKLILEDVFDLRCYEMFAFLAGVRNYSHVTPISRPRGIPDDASDKIKGHIDGDWTEHSFSWLSIEELDKFDYDQEFMDMRDTAYFDGTTSTLYSAGSRAGGRKITIRDFLGDAFFEEIEKLKAAGADRIVFWFDN